MFKSLFYKTLYDKRWFIVGWGVGSAAMVALTVAFYPTIKDQVVELFKNIPPQLQSLVGDTESYKTVTGYIGSGIFELRVPLITIAMAIILGINIGVGEESSGKLDQLLAQPLSRSRIILEKWLAQIAIVGVVHLAILVALFGIVAAIGESFTITAVVSATFISFLLTSAVASLVMAIGFISGRKGFSILISSVIAFGSYILTSLASQIDWLKYADYLSLFHYYHPAQVVKNGFNIGHVIVLSAIIVLSYAAAIFIFNRRDVGTHQ
jgi:ABC-2 type transport system permease protein